MSCCELEFACLIPKAKPEQLLSEPYVSYKGTDYKKTLRFKIPSCKPIKSRLKRFWNWICFVWLHSRSRKCRKICFLLFFTVFLTLFLVICVILPLAFKYSRGFKQFIIFNPIIAKHNYFDKVIEVYKDHNTKTYCKPKNFYVNISDSKDLNVGVWNIEIPNKKPYLLFFHDSSGNRDSYIKDYSRLMLYFHIIAFDYRGYGDSTLSELSERKLVQDGVEVFKWIKSHTNSSIFMWGDTLGAAIASHTVVELQKEKLSPCGLMLENPFTTLGEELGYSWFIAKMNWYTPWYTATFVNPLNETDLVFNTSEYIKQIHCPIFFWESTGHRAKHFVIDDTDFNAYSYKPQSTNRIYRLDVYPYEKYESFLSSDNHRQYLRFLIDCGEPFCNPKKDQGP